MTSPAGTAALRLIRPAELSGSTAQTSGMVRAAAISGDLVGARSMWMGRTVLPPELVRKFEGDAFWRDPARMPASVKVI